MGFFVNLKISIHHFPLLARRGGRRTCTMRSQSPKHWWQGWQLGNWPEKPRAHWSQRTPDTPCWQTQCPVCRLHWDVSMPRQSQSQAAEKKKEDVRQQQLISRQTLVQNFFTLSEH